MFRVLAIVLIAYVIAYPRLANNQPTVIEQPLAGIENGGGIISDLSRKIVGYFPFERASDALQEGRAVYR